MNSDRTPSPSWAIVCAGGSCPPATVAGRLRAERDRNPSPVVIAADSGWDCARSIDLVPAVLVGDLDSISASGLDEARRLGVAIHEHPVDKDHTDVEIAVDHAHALGAERITVLLGGDRIDHLFAALHVLADPRRRSVRLDGFVGASRVTRVVPGLETVVRTVVGATVSLLPVGGPARGVTTAGLRWALDGGVLMAHSSRGVSNVTDADTVTVSVSDGTLLVVEPEFPADVPDVAAAGDACSVTP